ncbi:MAG TPA: S8 family serine peptidase, partial [Myxococcota bacterium]|nr:S8 family serine peptidase [Myxococcota bacterium]
VVINLSVGWHPYYGGGMPGAWEIGSEGETVPSAGDPVFSWDKVDPSTFPPDVRAVFDALAYARCKGALAFAAAGNATAGPFGGSGPLLPAAWEGLDTAKIPSCEALGIPGIVAPTVVDPAVPLVVAVGGVDAADEPLSVGRPNSRPLLVADGDHARFDVQYSIVQTEGPSLTGTSVSAIVASSAAAALWSMDTKLTPSQVLQRLLDSGTPVGAADPWSLHAVESRYDAASLRPDDARDVQSRRLRVCDQLVGQQSGWICKETTLTSIGDFGQATQVDQIAGTWPGAAETDPACGDRQLFRAATASDPPASDPCPELQYFGPVIAPWVLPQPDQAGCSDCFLDVVGGKLFIQLNELWTAESLVMTVKAGSGTYEFALPASSIPDNQDSLAVSFNPASAPVGVTQASLTVVRLNRSVIFPVLVIGP